MIEKWKSLTKQAQCCFHHQNYRQSITLNRQALENAQQVFPDYFADDPDDAVAMMLVSYLNLIDNYEAINDRLVCENLFDQSFAFFQQCNPPEDSGPHHCVLMRGLNMWQKARYEYLHRIPLS